MDGPTSNSCEPLSFRHVVFAGDLPAPSQRVAPAWSPSAPRARSSNDQLRPHADALFRSVCRKRGVESTRYRAAVMDRREAACLRALKVRTIKEARQALEADGPHVDRAFGSLMIGVTSFFRDPPVFATLAPLLPTLHAQRGRIDVLSAACSDGRELYTVAMQLQEAGLLQASSLWGVDCRSDGVAVARAGVYPAEDAGAIPEPLRERFVAAAHGGVVVDASLRKACQWVRGDIFEDSPELPDRFDLILCRNVAIYLRPNAVSDLWKRLDQRLRPGGVLVVGKAERPLSAAPFRRLGSCVYQKPENSQT